MREPAADAIVIGAGVAGLAAARDLARGGKSVLVVEARPRTGGRVHSVQAPGLSMPIELGGEFVDRTANDAWDLVRDERLLALDVPDEHWYVERGRVDRSTAFWRDVQAALAREQDRPDRAFATFLREQFPGRAHAALRERSMSYVEGFHAADARRASTHELAAVEQAAGFGGSPQVVLAGGASAIVRSLAREANALGARIRVGCPVRSVRWRRHHVDVELAPTRGAPRPPLRAAAVVVTLPLPLLARPTAPGSVRFAPALTGKVRAARGLGMGAVSKLLLQFEEPVLDAARVRGAGPSGRLDGARFLHCPGAVVPTWWTTLPARTPLLTAWAAGPAALRLGRLAPHARVDAALRDLAQLSGASVARLRDRLVQAQWHDWQRDPFARGAYSYVLVGGTEARAQLAAPLLDTLFFAGEATAGEDAATIHGAFASGRRAARELLAARPGGAR